MSVAEKLTEVRAEIFAACGRAGRSVDGVRLVAVSKRQPTSAIREAWAAGQRDFGENYAQELRDKAVELADLDGVVWHAIGAVQSNKASMIARYADVLHAVDRVDVADQIARRRERVLPVFVEVNVAEEVSKHGVAPGELGVLLDGLRGVAGIAVIGLMTMPPWGDPEAARPWFRALKRLAGEHGLAELSMGSTDDFSVAVEEGATVVRVGRRIFGERA